MAVASGSCRSRAGFFAALGEYLELERPADLVTEACFVVLKGRGAGCRCRRPGWMRCWLAHGRGLVCRGARVISCGMRI
jgi:hypothetical protein